MASLVLRIRVEDHVTPLMKAISEMMLIHSEPLPPLPVEAVLVEQSIDPRGPSLRMLPSPDFLAWLADVKRMSRDKRVYVYAPCSSDLPQELTGEQAEVLSRL